MTSTVRQKEYSRSEPDDEPACSPLTRSAADAGVRVEKLATSTERSPASTGMPACVT